MAKTKSFDQPGTLHTKTLQLLKSDPRSLPDISIASGLPFYWLQRFHQSTFKNPSVNRIQHLFEFLSKKPLLKV